MRLCTRQIVKQSMAELASGQFDPKKVTAWELVSYTRVLASFKNLLELDPATLASGTQKIAAAINDLGGAQNLTDQQLWALAEMVGVFAEDFDLESVEGATSKLSEIIGSAEPSSGTGWALARSIEVMVPVLKPEERSRAMQYLIPLLGQNTDAWGAKAAPRALTALLPKLDPGQAEDVASAAPSVIATSASAAASNNDSSYLLTLMQVPEEVASTGDQAAVTAFGQALTKQFAANNEPLQGAALARFWIACAQTGALNCRQMLDPAPSAAPRRRAFWLGWPRR
jgi:hypothetical protein